MKILFISEGSGEDYQRDMIFHGLRSIFGADVVDSRKIKSLYNTEISKKSSLYGRGFTMYCNLPDLPCDRENIPSKIQAHYFDLIIFGSVHRNRDYYDIVKACYPKNKVAAIDGEDRWGGPFNGIFPTEFPYFKRECDENTNTFPIQFGIPKEKITKGIINKSTNLSSIIPQLRSASTYTFQSEEEYYKNYQQSCFAITLKKAGWDALRHYEIISNYCIPLFEEIEQCPPLTLHHFPKNLCIEINKIYNKNDLSMEKNHLWENTQYQYFLEQFIKTIPSLTTESMALRFIDKMRDL